MAVFQSTRSQDRDVIRRRFIDCGTDISIHSVARPRPVNQRRNSFFGIFQSTRSQDRDNSELVVWSLSCISIHSVARPRLKLSNYG